MLRLVVALLFALTLARDGAAQARDLNVTVRLRAYRNPIRLDTLAIWTEVLAPPAESFLALKRVLDSLKIPITTADLSLGLLHNPGFNARSKLAGRQMSWSLRCGAGMLGDYADSFRINLAYAVLIEPLPEGHSRVGLAMVSGAQNIEGVSTEPIECGTTGNLEQLILNSAHLGLLKKQLAP